MLKAWLIRIVSGEPETLDGPKDQLTGAIIQPPVRLMPRLASDTRAIYINHGRGLSRLASLPSSADTDSTDSNFQIPLRFGQQPNAVADPLMAEISSHHTSPISQNTSALCGVPYQSSNTSSSRYSTSLITPRGASQPFERATSYNERSPQSLQPRISFTAWCRIFIKKLRCGITKEQVNDLLEGVAGRYLRHDGIKLVEINEQLHAYTSIPSKQDAEQAKQKLNGLHFQGKKLKVWVEDIDIQQHLTISSSSLDVRPLPTVARCPLILDESANG